VIEKALIRVERLPDTLLANLQSRDVALWIRSLPKDPPSQSALVAFLGLPWRLVLSETYDAELIAELESRAPFDDPMTRKRGFIQVIDGDPSRISLPQRSLPLYLLSGRATDSGKRDFDSRLRRLTMLEELRRSNVRALLVLSVSDDPVPPELTDLWSSGFRSTLTFAASAPDAYEKARAWLEGTEGPGSGTFLLRSPSEVVDDILARYASTYPEDRHVLRVRDRQGNFVQIDVTEADEPERPILEWYSLIEDRDLTPLTPDELAEGDFVSFFRDPESSWRSYAAGLPWIREMHAQEALMGHLKRLDAVGAEANRIAYVASESGAGGTTLARALAWECARRGYPVLLAKPLPFVPDALPVANYLKRIHDGIESRGALHATVPPAVSADTSASSRPPDPVSLRYEAPWVLVFDTLHWQHRDSDLVRFRSELEKSGRPVCILVVTGTVLELAFYNTAVFKKLVELNHAISQGEASQLGRHLNRFLRVYGKERADWQWKRFYEEHTVRYLEGTAAFWVTLSFWIQGQYDLTESIQQWMYRSFKASTHDVAIREALLEIAALSSERVPLPEGLLPPSRSQWPLSHLLEDARPHLAALGLVRIRSGSEKHWALVHDILGRFLINAIFFDFSLRQELGFAEARDAEHLRFLLLRKIAHKARLGEEAYRPIGEEFATSIFKIDPDHGHASFAMLWREVLESLDTMSPSLRSTSRLFRHHIAISRRRIAKLDERFYGVTTTDRLALLTQAIEDLLYALNYIEATPGTESNLNLLNSLANAYLDLAALEVGRGAARERIGELRRLADEATRRAYQESPTNSFVVETYVKNLLQNAEESSDRTVEECVEALGILFSALAGNEATYRASQLGGLADRALKILLQQRPTSQVAEEPTNALEVLIRAWMTLAEGSDRWSETGLTDVSEENRLRALAILAQPAGQGNMQVIRLSYDLTCMALPDAFKRQLELVEQLEATDYRMTPQLRLEYAILLFQNARAAEGDKIFRALRHLWRESEHFVQVPERLRWLRGPDAKALQTVRATVGSDQENRAMARVQDFGNALVPFRPEEHGIRELKPGLRLACHVSFGHNGPFLRPVTAYPTKSAGG
jgi:hypothetical protein